MRKLDVLIVDDEPVAIRRLSRLLGECEGATVAGSAANAAEALALVTRTSPDLLLLDIEMPGGSGVALASQIRGLANPPSIVFVTAFSRFALEAFDVAATDYLLKPVELPRLIEAIERVRALRPNRQAADRIAELEVLVERLRGFERASREQADAFLWLPAANGRERVLVAQIVWVEAERDYVRVHTAARSYFVRGRIGRFEERLSGHGIVRVHRSAMVRASAIARIEAQGDRAYRLILSNGAVVRASRRLGTRIRALTASEA